VGRIESLNRQFFLTINAGPGTPPWVIDGAILIANDLISLIPALLLAIWLWGDRHQRSVAVRAFLVAMLGVGLNQVIGLLWPHPRPFMIGLGHTWLAHAADSSFPSDHLTVFCGIGLSLLLGGAMLLGVGTLIIGLGVAWARVFLGLHFPLDMLGAFGVACLSYLALVPFWWKAGDGLMRLLERMYRMIMRRPIVWGWVRR